jgi:hypothetical protein
MPLGPHQSENRDAGSISRNAHSHTLGARTVGLYCVERGHALERRGSSLVDFKDLTHNKAPGPIAAWGFVSESNGCFAEGPPRSISSQCEFNSLPNGCRCCGATTTLPQSNVLFQTKSERLAKQQRKIGPRPKGSFLCSALGPNLERRLADSRRITSLRISGPERR